jgi:hypothetical protein
MAVTNPLTDTVPLRMFATTVALNPPPALTGNGDAVVNSNCDAETLIVASGGVNGIGFGRIAESAGTSTAVPFPATSPTKTATRARTIGRCPAMPVPSGASMPSLWPGVPGSSVVGGPRYSIVAVPVMFGCTVQM